MKIVKKRLYESTDGVVEDPTKDKIKNELAGLAKDAGVDADKGELDAAAEEAEANAEAVAADCIALPSVKFNARNVITKLLDQAYVETMHEIEKSKKLPVSYTPSHNVLLEGLPGSGKTSIIRN